MYFEDLKTIFMLKTSIIEQLIALSNPQEPQPNHFYKIPHKPESEARSCWKSELKL